MGTGRVVYLDIAKCMAIYLVCLGHTHPSYNGFIYSFHMPLFMLMSGYFSGRSLQMPLLPFLKKKAISLLLPAITVSLLSIIIHFLFYGVDNQFFIKELYGCAWFLKCLFLCYVAAWLALFLCKKQWIAILVSSSLVFVIPICHTFNFNFFLLFFWTGYILKKTNVLEKVREYYLVIIPIALYVCFYFVGGVRPYQTIWPHTVFHTPEVLIVQYFVGLTGALLFLGLSRIIAQSKRVSTIIQNVGTYTLGIYILQILLLERLLQYTLLERLVNDIPCLMDCIIRPAIAILVVVVCFYLIQLLKRTKIVNLLLFGGVYRDNNR